MTPRIGSDAVDAYLQQAIRGDGRAAVRLALDLIDDGVPGNDVIVDLLGAAQREAGERWLAGDWTIADEHLISGVCQKVLDAIAATIEPSAATGRVVVACAEGDWHSLPAQMIAEMLRAHGFAVTFLGASTPVDHVAALLSRHRPDVLAVSCNLALFFGSVIRLVAAAHRRRIPVIAGGRALGRGPGRAARLGADAWAAGADGAAAVLRGWQRQPPHVSAGPALPGPAAVRLDMRATEIASEAFQALSSSYPPMASFNDSQLARTRGNLACITRFTAAARLVADRTVLTEMLDWLRTLLASRGVPPTALSAGLAALAPIIRRADPGAARFVLGAMRDEAGAQAPSRGSQA